MFTCTKCDAEKPAIEFYVSGGRRRSECKECGNAMSRKWRAENPEKYKASKHKSEAKYPDRVAARHRRWRAKNPERARELSIEAAYKWRRENPEQQKKVARLRAANRRAKVAKRTLPGNERWIEAIYDTASGLGLEVDHVVPLNGQNVSGLHVPWNMQLLSRSRNATKSNAFAA